MTPRVLVLGAGVAGLATALFLARRGVPVDLVERDRSAVPTGVRAAGGWHRASVPQGTHSHSFPAGTRALLAAEAPDVLDGLRDAGVREIALRPPLTLRHRPAAPPELVALAARRPVFEWVLRRAVERERDVRVHAGTEVVGVVESGGRLAGVEVPGGVVDADLVVDAAGEGSPVPGWLAAKGRPVPERAWPGEVTHYTRFWVLHRTADPGVLDCGATAGGSYDGYSCHVFPADNGTFSVTFAARSDDEGLSGLRETAAFDAAATRIPAVASWIDSAVAVPISGVSVLAGPGNRLRTLAPSGVPVLPGLLAVGDAGCTTDVAHGRGTTLALESALAAAAVLAEHRTDQAAVTAAADAAQQELLSCWFEDSVRQTGARLAAWRGERPPQPAPGALSHADIAVAAQREPEVWTASTAVRHLLRRPDTVLADPRLASLVRDTLDGPWRPEPPEAPGHDELTAAVLRAAPRRVTRVAG